MASFRILLCLFAVAIYLNESAHAIDKRRFTDLGCMGTYEKSRFARLEALCEECFQLYKEPDLYVKCRSNCFNNGVFNKCVDALLYHNEKEDLQRTVEMIYGKKK